MSIELYPRSITTERALFCRCGGAGVFYPHKARIQAIQTDDGERYFAGMSTAEGEEDWVFCVRCGKVVELKGLLLSGECCDEALDTEGYLPIGGER